MVLISSVYIIKCSSFYKIGFSKNPKNRVKTIQTHCPLKVQLIATFKTNRHIEIELELHNLFKEKRTNGEWFELSPEDLLKLKLEFGFTFLKPIDKITQDNTFDYNSNELINNRALNEEFSKLKSTFEIYFSCTITNTSNLEYCHKKYGFKYTMEAIDDLNNTTLTASEAYENLKKYSKNTFEIVNNSQDFFSKVIASIYKHHYKDELTGDEFNFLYNQMDFINNTKKQLKDINSQKFYLTPNGFWKKFVCHE